MQAEQIDTFLGAWSHANHPGIPRVAVARTILPIVSEDDRRRFGPAARRAGEHVGILGCAVSLFGKSLIGEPNAIIDALADDEAASKADTILLTIPNTLGVAENLNILGNIQERVLQALNW